MTTSKTIVIAGTPVDTQMGVALAQQADLPEPLFMPISRSPQEQNEMQYLERDELQRVFEEKIIEGAKLGADRVFLYCNSLSTAVDYEGASARTGLPIVTPLETYTAWASRYSRLALIAANSQAATGIEGHMRAQNPTLELVALGLLPVVEAIEAQLPPAQIVHDFKLGQLFDWFGELQPPFGPPEGIVLGCTHFPYIKEELARHTSVPLLDPAATMLAELAAL